MGNRGSGLGIRGRLGAALKPLSQFDMSYSLNSLLRGYIGDYIGTTIGDIRGDTRSLDNGSYGFFVLQLHIRKKGILIIIGLCRQTFLF